MKSIKPSGFKLILQGECNDLKKDFVKRLRRDQSLAESSTDEGKLLVRTNHGCIQYNIWNVNGQKSREGFCDEFYMGGDCAFIMFDISDGKTFKNVSAWIKEITRVCRDGLPIVLLGAHGLVSNPKVKQHQISACLQKYVCKGKNVYYYPMHNNNDEELLLFLTRKLVDDKSLYIYQPLDWIKELAQAAGTHQHPLSKEESFLLGILNAPLKNHDDDSIFHNKAKKRQDQVVKLLVKSQKTQEDAGGDTSPLSILAEVVGLLPVAFFHSPKIDHEPLKQTVVKLEDHVNQIPELS